MIVAGKDRSKKVARLAFKNQELSKLRFRIISGRIKTVLALNTGFNIYSNYLKSLMGRIRAKTIDITKYQSRITHHVLSSDQYPFTPVDPGSSRYPMRLLYIQLDSYMKHDQEETSPHSHY